MRFAAVPQVLAGFASFALLRFETNVREATVLGFVGAGGIGQDLMEAIRKFYYADVSAILVLVIVVVVAIDISAHERLCRALSHRKTSPREPGSTADLAAISAALSAIASGPIWSSALPGRRFRTVGALLAGDLYRRPSSTSTCPGRAVEPAGFAAARSGFVELMVPPDPGGHFWTYLNALGETLAIAFLGTLTGRRCSRCRWAYLGGPQHRAARAGFVMPLKRLFDVVRGIDTLIWALIWINVVGLGPFAGVLAIATSDFGALGKLFAEIIESADAKPPEGVRASGGGRFSEVRFGLLPQVAPVIAGQILYYIESNTRSGDDYRRRRRRRHWSSPL